MSDRAVLLSQAHVTDLEVEALTRAVTSGWVAPLGPEVDGFEADIRDYTGAAHALALTSGTAAIHLGLMGLGVKAGDNVIVPTLTFGATAFAVTYTGAKPVFVDVEPQAWGLDAEVLQSVLDLHARSGRQIAAIVPVDLFGRPADYDQILPIAAKYNVPVLVDAAESLGATHGARAAGTMGQAGVYSFNGNKIMTTSGGGMLVSANEQLIEKARFWSTQSREPFPWYEHEEIGYNYRLSNILAALGRAQLARLPEMIARRSEVRGMYTEMLAGLEGVVVTPDPPWGTGNSWLTTVSLDRGLRPGAPTRVRESLQAQNIESRPIWKPMHQQPVFRDHEAHLTGVADRLFDEGLCLPSGVGLTDADIERVAGRLQGGVGMTATRRAGTGLYARGGKRAFDLVASTSVGIVSLPLQAVIAAFVRAKLGSPVLFRQERPGRNGRPFILIKFRTMTDGQDAHGELLPDEVRLTPFGQFLRSTSFDELPELWNVVKGDMSLVGPRPLLMRYLPLYSSDQARRHEVRPGVTGWSQVNGRNSTDWPERLALDTWYVENESFLLDVKILLKTVTAVFARHGISADGHATAPEFTGTDRGTVYRDDLQSGIGDS